MEAVRPSVDAYVFDLLQNRVFKKSDFFETREGICRVMPPLTHELAETSVLWVKEVGPATERVAKRLFGISQSFSTDSSDGAPTGKPMPTPLTESNRSAGRGPYKRKPEIRKAEEIRAWLFR